MIKISFLIFLYSSLLKVVWWWQPSWISDWHNFFFKGP